MRLSRVQPAITCATCESSSPTNALRPATLISLFHHPIAIRSSIDGCSLHSFLSRASARRLRPTHSLSPLRHPCSAPLRRVHVDSLRVLRQIFLLPSLSALRSAIQRRELHRCSALHF